jgi:hypothetical protein
MSTIVTMGGLLPTPGGIGMRIGELICSWTSSQELTAQTTAKMAVQVSSVARLNLMPLIIPDRVQLS